MSLAVMERVWKHSQQTGTDLVVLLRLADQARNDDGSSCFPSVDDLAAAANITARGVRKVLRKLEASGEVEVLRRGGSAPGDTTHYRVVVGLEGVQADMGVHTDMGVRADMGVQLDMGVQQGSYGCPPGSERGVRADLQTVREPKQPVRNTSDDVREIFEFWRNTFGKDDKTKLTSERRSKVKARLSSYSVADIKTAITNVAASDFHVTNGHIDLTLICRSDSKLEEFRDEVTKRGASRRSGLDKREAAMRSLDVGRDDRETRSAVKSRVRTLLYPPQPGEIDPFTETPVMQPDQAREELAQLVPDVAAAVEEHRAAIEAEHRRLRRVA